MEQRLCILLAALVAVVVCLSTARADVRSTPRMLKPVTIKFKLEAALTDLSSYDCKDSLKSCIDCANALTCTKLGNTYRALSTTACSGSTPYCNEGQCSATPPADACDNSAAARTDFQCIGNGYFPSPADCHKYFLCVDNQAYEYDCTQFRGTVYSHEKAMCVPSSEAVCSTVSCTKANIGAYQLWSPDRSVYFVCTDTTPANAYVADCGEDREIDPSTGDCVMACLREGRLPDGDDDKGFYECIATSATTFTGPTRRTCPGSSTFDKDSQRCVTESEPTPTPSPSPSVTEDYFAPSANVPESMYNLPPKSQFRIGSASAAYQIEGGWNASGKGVSIQDTYFHSRPHMANGDIACDSYHLWREDIAALKALGMEAYRFSLAWTRILPEGDQASGANEDGVQYYMNIIQELLANDIEPIVTVYHWDLPQRYQDDGGWLNSNIVDRYVDYADYVFSLYGQWVKKWVLVNEPHVFCSGAYETGTMAPGVAQPGTGAYECVHNMILAHASAYRLYDEKYRATQQGILGSSLDIQYYEPMTDSESDKAAAKRMMEFALGWIADPLTYGDYPKVMRDMVDANSRGAGLAKSRLPEFTEEQKTLIKGAWDFMGINHYTTTLATEATTFSATPSYSNDTRVMSTTRDTWYHSARYFFATCPWGMRAVLNYIKDNYNNMPVLISENGWAGPYEESLDDGPRVGYYSTYMRAVMRAINEDKCNVIGYTAWSLEDNLEWADGYDLRFGLVHVDFEDPNRKRTLKDSSSFFQTVFQTRNVPYHAPSSYKQ